VHGAAALALGNGAAMTFPGMRRLVPRAVPNILMVDLAPGAGRAATFERLQRRFSATSPMQPAEVGNWGRVGEFPLLVASLVAAAAAALLAHALVTSIKRRGRDIAILKMLGFERHDVRATLAWQATTIAAVGLLAGVPIGLGIGRFAWNLFAADLGVASEPVAPVWPGLLVIPAAVLLANLVALLPGRIAADTPPGAVLRAE
jgi:predicted lysophospholipase L1 biosynthesis ABC-type transport system permease subunit